jgi:hypothetical protein
VSNLKEALKNKVKKEHKNAHDILIETQENEDIISVNKQDRKIKFEENFTRQTYYIENNLLEKLNESVGKEKGEKTRIINEALRSYFKNKFSS